MRVCVCFSSFPIVACDIWEYSLKSIEQVRLCKAQKRGAGVAYVILHLLAFYLPGAVLNLMFLISFSLCIFVGYEFCSICSVECPVAKLRKHLKVHHLDHRFLCSSCNKG